MALNPNMAWKLLHFNIGSCEVEGVYSILGWGWGWGGSLPLASPGVRYTADNRAEHQSCDEGEEHEVDEAFQSIIT